MNRSSSFIYSMILNVFQYVISSLVLCNNLVGRQNTPSPSWSEAPVKCQVKHGEGAPRSSSRWHSWKPHWSLKRRIHAMVRVCPWHRIPPPGDLKRPGSIRGAKPLRWVWYGHDMVVCWKEKQRNRLRKSRFWLHLEVEKVSKNLILVESRTVVEVSIKFNPYLKAVFASCPIWEPPARRKRVGSRSVAEHGAVGAQQPLENVGNVLEPWLFRVMCPALKVYTVLCFWNKKNWCFTDSRPLSWTDSGTSLPRAGRMASFGWRTRSESKTRATFGWFAAMNCLNSLH